MTFIEEPSVTVVEVAKRAGLTVDEVEAEAATLNMFIGVDWKHEAALPTREAYALVDGSARRNLEHETAFQAHMAALEGWQKERENVRRAAFDEAWKASVQAGHNNGPATDKAHAAAREAVAAFERVNPEPVFSEPESRIQNWLKRVRPGTR